MHTPQHSISLLYIDEEPALLEITRHSLEAEGEFSVTTAPSAYEALRLMKDQPFDAVVSGYQMPGMDGIEFLNHVRSSGSTVPFIIFTGRGREEVVIEALNSGADFYLQKGGDPKARLAELTSMIRQAVSRNRTELSLQDSVRRLSDIINFLPDATFAIDTDGRVIAWNRAIAEMTAVPARDMLEKGTYEYALPFHHERRPMLIDCVLTPHEELTLRYFPSPMKEGDTLIAEISPPGPPGKQAVLLGRASALYDSTGRISGAIESIRDITESRKTEAARQRSEQQYRNIVENVNSVILTRDNHGAITFMNEFGEQLFGFTKEELVGHQVIGTIVPPVESTGRDLVQLIRDISADPEKFRNNENENVRKDGSRIWMKWANRTLLDEHGKPAGVLAVGVDITEKKAVDNALRESEERYRILTEHAFDGVMIQNFSGKVLCANPSIVHMLGFSDAAEIIGQNALSFVAPEYRTLVMRGMQNVIAGKGDNSQKYRATRKDRTSILVEAAGTRITYQGEPADIIALRDLTERERVEESLRRANAKLNLLNSVTRHDVNNQIHALLGYTQLAQVQNTDAIVADFLSKVEIAGTLISRQLDFTRTYQNLGTKDPCWQDLGKVVDTAAPKNLSFANDCRNIQIFSDPMLENVFANLFDNACRHGEHVTHISVWCMEAENGMLIIVEDNGAGVPLDLKSKIFEKGFGKHTGFGLFLAREILAITGISIHETGAHGRGARFEMFVPDGMFRIRAEEQGA